MKNSLAITANGRGVFNTLAQSETGQKGKVVSIGTIVRGNGAILSNRKQHQSWARKKLICQMTMLPLIEIAKERKAKDREKSYRNTYYCFNKLYSSENRLYGQYCKNRFCPVCCGIRKAELMNNYFPILSKWNEPYFLTLTVKATSASDLAKLIDEMYKLFITIKLKYKKRKQRGKGFELVGIKSFECNFNPISRTYNPHFHILLPSLLIGDSLRDEWIREGTKLWGKKAITPLAQKLKKVLNIERDLIEIIKYSSKVFTSNEIDRSKKGQKVTHKIFVRAFDRIIEVMKGRRVFDRFGFNKPKRIRKTNIQLLENSMEWYYDSKYSDWLDKDSGIPLSGYVPSHDLESTMKTFIDKDLY